MRSIARQHDRPTEFLRALQEARMTPNERSIADGAKAAREQYKAAHGHYPEERGERPRYRDLRVMMTESEYRAVLDAAREAGQGTSDYIRERLGL